MITQVQMNKICMAALDAIPYGKTMKMKTYESGIVYYKVLNYEMTDGSEIFSKIKSFISKNFPEYDVTYERLPANRDNFVVTVTAYDRSSDFFFSCVNSYAAAHGGEGGLIWLVTSQGQVADIGY